MLTLSPHLRTHKMTKGERLEVNFRNAMLLNICSSLEQGFITHQTFEVILNSLEYTHIKREVKPKDQ